MKPYEQLTRLGRLRRLRQVALQALKAYDLKIATVNFLIEETNTMFQVRTTDGRRLVLRIYSEQETTLKENRAEMFWLTALHRDTNLNVIRPVARVDGDYITIVEHRGVPGAQRCALFHWIPGRPLEAGYLNPKTYYLYGQLLAALHNHAQTLNPLPGDINPKRWDKVFYYPDEPVVYKNPAYSHLFPPERIDLLERVIARANAVFAQLFADDTDLMLIHGDLHFWNVHYDRGQLYALDFEDINLGYPVQDIAVTLSYGRQRQGYADWRKAFQAGYVSKRPWPNVDERVIDTLIAARSAMFINYVAHIDYDAPEEYIAARCANLVEYLAT